MCKYILKEKKMKTFKNCPNQLTPLKTNKINE